MYKEMAIDMDIEFSMFQQTVKRKTADHRKVRSKRFLMYFSSSAGSILYDAACSLEYILCRF